MKSLTAALLVMFIATACSGEKTPPTIDTDAGPMPPGVERYADCAFAKTYSPFTGSNAGGDVYPTLQTARCRLLAPKDTGVHSREDYNRCIQNQKQWLKNHYNIPHWDTGSMGIRARAYGEAVCAPMPPPTP